MGDTKTPVLRSLRLLALALAAVAGGEAALGLLAGGAGPPAVWWQAPLPLAEDAVPRAARTYEAGVLAAKVRLATTGPEARVICIGDSSATHGFDPAAFREATGRAALNLGTFGFADTAGHRALLEAALAARPRVEDVVLWVHPRTLARSREAHRATDWPRRLDAFLAGRDPFAPALRLPLPSSRLNRAAQARLAPWLDVGLARGARRLESTYGSPEQLFERLVRDRGFLAASPGPVTREALPRARPEHLRTLAATARLAREHGARFVLVVQPTNARTRPGGFRNALVASLRDLAADIEPTPSLPDVLPVGDFASDGHLTPRAARRFTRALAQALDD